MSELINTYRHYAKGQLLSGASVLVLVGAIGSASAAESDRPTVWIEVGSQLERFAGGSDPFAPPFATDTDWAAIGLTSPIAAQKQSLSSFGAVGKISIQPDGSDWVYSASIQFGRANGKKTVHQQLKGGSQYFDFRPLGYGTKYLPDYLADTRTASKESHAIVDFTVGKEVGIGSFGTSTISLGLRFAQFHSAAGVTILGRADQHFIAASFYGFYLPLKVFRAYNATAHGTHSFKGLGPSVSWTASAPLMGSPDEGQLALDWGLNGALLFGKQKVKVQGNVTAHGYNPLYHVSSQLGWYRTVYQAPVENNRRKSVTVPNLGGFAGVSYRFDRAKLSVGYRADFFFNAMDSGVDARNVRDVGFFGPYASVSIGLGG